MPDCTCPSCSYVEPEPDYYSGFDDESYDDDDDYGSDYIKSYSYKPDPVFHGDGPLYLGMELELESGYSSTVNQLAERATMSLGDLAYLKEDGSLSSGFEIVTHPMTYEYAMAKFPWELLTELGSGGAETHDETGIHVHVSRDGFTGPPHMYRWMKFMYRNDRKVQTFAHRESSQWANFSRSARRAVKEAVQKDGWDKYRQARYQAINVQNVETLELRIFRSSLNPDRVKAILAFVAATVEYTRTLSAYAIAHADGWSWDTFASWAVQRPEYAVLATEEVITTCAY